MKKIFVTWFPLVVFLVGSLVSCKLDPNRVAGSENDAIKCVISGSGNVEYDVICTAKIPEVRVTRGVVRLTSRVKQGKKHVTRTLAETDVVSEVVVVTPDKPLRLKGRVPKGGIVGGKQRKLTFSADLHYGEQDPRAKMDADEIRKEEANFKRRYQILATTRL